MVIPRSDVRCQAPHTSWIERLFGNDDPPARATAAPPPAARVPLATRLRPRTLEEFVGQDRLLAAGSALRRAIE
jgi:hypothetical protein